MTTELAHVSADTPAQDIVVEFGPTTQLRRMLRVTRQGRDSYIHVSMRAPDRKGASSNSTAFVHCKFADCRIQKYTHGCLSGDVYLVADSTSFPITAAEGYQLHVKLGIEVIEL